MHKLLSSMIQGSSDLLAAAVEVYITTLERTLTFLFGHAWFICTSVPIHQRTCTNLFCQQRDEQQYSRTHPAYTGLTHNNQCSQDNTWGLILGSSLRFRISTSNSQWSWRECSSLQSYEYHHRCTWTQKPSSRNAWCTNHGHSRRYHDPNTCQ